MNTGLHLFHQRGLKIRSRRAVNPMAFGADVQISPPAAPEGAEKETQSMHRTSFRILMALFLGLIAGACQAQAGTNATPMTVNMTIPATASISSSASTLTIDYVGHTVTPFSLTYSYNGLAAQHGFIETYFSSAASALVSGGFGLSANWFSVQVGAGSFVACGSVVSVGGTPTAQMCSSTQEAAGQPAVVGATQAYGIELSPAVYGAMVPPGTYTGTLNATLYVQ